MAAKELSSINTSGELVVINLGGTTPEHKLLTSTEVDAKLQVLENTLTAPKTTLEAEGHVPAVILEVENGGVASTVETTYNNGTNTHAVSTIQWLAAQNEADWTLSNKDTGVVETMFRILNGGKATIGTALLQQEIAVVDTARYTDALGDGVLDGLTTTGLYITNDTALPAEVSGQAIVKVIEHNTTDFISQQASDYAGGKSNLMFRSSVDGGANWSVWTDKSGASADSLNVDEINKLIRSYDVTIEINTGHNVPTKTECINAFNQLPHADYTKDDSFHIMSTNKDRMNFVKYLANGSTDADNYTVGLFFVQELSLAT